jgi:hypothetical protein
MSEQNEPVLFQYRTRPTWGHRAHVWQPWTDCAEGVYEDYLKAPKSDWEYEVRKLYAAPIASVVPDADKRDAERYRFIRSMIHMTNEEKEAVGDVMAGVFDLDQEGIPTDAEWDACIDAAIAAAPKEPT